jgi:hypothetical protein
MPTFFKYSPSFNIVFHTGPFHTGATQLLWCKNHYKFFMRRKRTSRQMAVKLNDGYVRSKMVRNYVESNWWLRMLLLCHALPIHTHFPHLQLWRHRRVKGVAEENFLIVQTGSGDHTAFYLTANVDLFPGYKDTNLKPDYSLPLSTKFKSPWRYTSTPQDA